jgi:hyperosmotically inducible protein
MKMRHSIIAGSALLAAAALAAAPALAADSKDPSLMQKTKDTVKETTREAKTEVTDSWVTAKTKIALFSDSRVKGRQIKVETMKGMVTLRGKVDSEDAKSAAGEVAKGVEHVKGVKNDLQVVTPKERKSVDISDKEINARVEKRLKQDAGLKKIAVRTDAGVVTLTGEAPDITASARASELASAVSGVQSVKNEVQLNPKMSRHRSDKMSRSGSDRVGSPALSS